MNHRIGTAGWTIPKDEIRHFPSAEDGSHLQRYSERLSAVEINSSFYRPHQAKTYRRWAEETSAPFNFSVKMTKVFTHEKQLDVDPSELALWLEPVKELGGKLGAILVQIPPKQEYAQKTAAAFFKALRKEIDATVAIAFEPRHLSWTHASALKLFESFDVTKVEADPERCPSAPTRTKRRYIRLHGSPAIYKSRYSKEAINHWAEELKQTSEPSWVIFDNTTFGYATANALELQACLKNSRRLKR